MDKLKRQMSSRSMVSIPSAQSNKEKYHDSPQKQSSGLSLDDVQGNKRKRTKWETVRDVGDNIMEVDEKSSDSVSIGS